jgi:predicted enzyme related to lactoylglutathione lyase
MSSSAVLGQYLWHELLTTDPAAGAGFYSKVFGWKAQPFEGHADYTMLAHEKGPVGGARVVGKDSLADTAGPNWLTYVGVPDLAAALATAATHGGKVIHPVTELPSNGGRYAVIADPQGATIGLFEPGAGGTGGPMASPVAWHELTAEDPQAALQFYKALFGWEVVATHAMGGDVGTYYLFGVGTTQRGGAYLRAKHVAPTWPRWLIYVDVPSVTAAVAAAQAAGGKLLNEPHQVPGGMWVAQVLDSHGVALALHGAKEVAATAPKAPAKPKAKAAPKAEAKPAAKPAAKPKVKAKAKAKSKPVAAKANPKPKAKTKTKTKSKAKRKAAPKTKTKTKSKSKPKTRVKVKAKAKARKTPRRAK